MEWYVYSLLSALAITIVSLLQQRVLKTEHSLEYVTILNIAKLVLFISIFSQSITLAVTPWNFFLLGIAGLLGGCGLLFTVRALRALDMSVVLPILALDPALVVLLAFLVLGESLTVHNVLGIALMIVGTYVLEFHRSPDPSLRNFFRHPHTLLQPFKNLGTGPGKHSLIIALCAYALSSILDRYMLQRVPINTYIVYAYLFGTMLYLTLLATTRTRLNLGVLRKGSFIWVILLIAAFNVAGNVAQARAVSMVAVGLAISVKRLSVLFDVIIGGKLFHEHHLLQRAIASVITLAGVALVVAG